MMLTKAEQSLIEQGLALLHDKGERHLANNPHSIALKKALLNKLLHIRRLQKRFETNALLHESKT